MEPVYIVVALTTTGKVCESHATYEEARRRVEALPAECLLSAPLIFQELPDGSQRLVRDDGKPLQIHRLPFDEPDVPEEPLPLSEPIPLGTLREPQTPWDDVEEEPIRLEDLPPEEEDRETQS